ncbi:proline-rich protein 2-like isoform X2 [Passer montanus]|uniref:proline-rich protein 2-like isoform X2 n=1 Tax=Passer montanus TaxID=9160 RepID=UPI001960F2CC|nr:proline-rich protein 2-like isoform X2 [Passer montanus]
MPRECSVRPRLERKALPPTFWAEGSSLGAAPELSGCSPPPRSAPVRNSLFLPQHGEMGAAPQSPPQAGQGAPMSPQAPGGISVPRGGGPPPLSLSLSSLVFPPASQGRDCPGHGPPGSPSSDPQRPQFGCRAKRAGVRGVGGTQRALHVPPKAPGSGRSAVTPPRFPATPQPPPAPQQLLEAEQRKNKDSRALQDRGTERRGGKEGEQMFLGVRGRPERAGASLRGSGKPSAAGSAHTRLWRSATIPPPPPPLPPAAAAEAAPCFKTKLINHGIGPALAAGSAFPGAGWSLAEGP